MTAVSSTMHRQKYFVDLTTIFSNHKSSVRRFSLAMFAFDLFIVRCVGVFRCVMAVCSCYCFVVRLCDFDLDSLLKFGLVFFN